LSARYCDQYGVYSTLLPQVPLQFYKSPLWLPLSLALATGVLMAMAPAPLNLWGVAWMALAPLWVLVVRGEKASLLCAAAWGLGYHAPVLFWITGLHPLTWMGIPWLASVAITLFCWGFVTFWGVLQVTLWAWLFCRSQCHCRYSESSPAAKSIAIGIRRVLMGTALWCGIDWVWSLGALYWTPLSFTQSPGNLAIVHLGQLSGPAIVTGAIVAVNGCLAEAWIARSRSPKPEAAKRNLAKFSGAIAQFFVALAVLLLVSSHAIGYALSTRPLEQPPETALKVGIVQGNIPTRTKLSETGVRRAIQGFTNGYELLVSQGAAAVLTPEGAFPFVWDQASNPLFRAVVDRGAIAWLGTFVREQNTITQSLLTLTPNGVFSRYNKIKLVPLGEYIPFQEILGGVITRLSPIRWSMVPGSIHQRFDTSFGKAIASICYESGFPGFFRAQTAAGGQFILTVSNLDPYSEVLMSQHQAHDLMRSIETDRWAVRATNTGYSGIIDPHGRIVWRSQPQTYQTHAETIYRRQTQTLYVRWGDWFTPLMIGVGAIGWLRPWRFASRDQESS
jgi:apolipoprotein N-acyltransferase